jgi:hypothetical protein
MMLFGGMGIVEGPHRVPSAFMLDEQHDRVLNLGDAVEDENPHKDAGGFDLWAILGSNQ